MTGVQTCALPSSASFSLRNENEADQIKTSELLSVQLRYALTLNSAQISTGSE